MKCLYYYSQIDQLVCCIVTWTIKVQKIHIVVIYNVKYIIDCRLVNGFFFLYIFLLFPFVPFRQSLHSLIMN